jgi:hypothetical protein
MARWRGAKNGIAWHRQRVAALAASGALAKNHQANA